MFHIIAPMFPSATLLLQLQKRKFTITKGAVVLNIFVSFTIAIEKLLEGCDSKFATGDEVQLADVFLAPQIHAGVTRFDIDMSKYPHLERFYKAYMEIPAFQAARPENQPDAPSPPQ
uniref:GST C-terminal domain-containing protein n=1 Tax=Aegilops tauschii subsp. strangulata TaxID=200361 RepID=A0A453SYD5_AEGTS